MQIITTQDYEGLKKTLRSYYHLHFVWLNCDYEKRAEYAIKGVRKWVSKRTWDKTLDLCEPSVLGISGLYL